jgi:smad nuclear-interacting protein 1
LPSQSSALASAGVPSGNDRYGKRKQQSRSPSPSAEAIAASKPNFANSGALAAETNTFKGVVLKYSEPPEARKPNKGWRMYVFKGKEQVDMIQVNRQSAFLFGRDRVVADVPLDHPSASKQHAVLQFRQAHERNEFGDTKSVTK